MDREKRSRSLSSTSVASPTDDDSPEEPQKSKQHGDVVKQEQGQRVANESHRKTSNADEEKESMEKKIVALVEECDYNADQLARKLTPVVFEAKDHEMVVEVKENAVVNALVAAAAASDGRFFARKINEGHGCSVHLEHVRKSRPYVAKTRGTRKQVDKGKGKKDTDQKGKGEGINQKAKGKKGKGQRSKSEGINHNTSYGNYILMPVMPIQM